MFIEQSALGKNEIGRWFAMLLLVAVMVLFIGPYLTQINLAEQALPTSDIDQAIENQSDLALPPIASTPFAIQLVAPLLGLFTLIFLLRPIHERSFTTLISTKRPIRWNRIGMGFSIWFIGQFGFILFGLLNGRIKAETINFSSFMGTGVFLNILLALLVTLFNELFFRGYLLQGLGLLTKSRWRALLSMVVLYTASYAYDPDSNGFASLPTLFQVGTFSLLLGVCTLLDEGIELAIGIHLARYSIQLLMGGTIISGTLWGFEVAHPTSWPTFGYSLTLSALLLFVAPKIWPWNSWRSLGEPLHLVLENEENDLLGWGEDEYKNDDL